VEQVIKGIEQELGVTELPVCEAGGHWHRGQEIVQQLAQQDLALLIVLSTPALSLVAPKIKHRPLIVFGMVADPYSSGAAYDRRHPEDHQGNVTGQNARRYAPLLLKWGQEQKLLVVNGHPEFQSPGAILSVTTDYQVVGKLTAALARRILQGESPVQIPIQHETPMLVKVDERLLEKWSGYPPES